MVTELLQFHQVPGGLPMAIRGSAIEAVLEHELGHTIIVTASDTYQVAEAFAVVVGRAVVIPSEKNAAG